MPLPSIRIHAAARQGWEFLDVAGTIEEAIATLRARPLDQLEIRPMMPTRDLREVWGIYNGRRVGLIVSVDAIGRWRAVRAVCGAP